MECPALILVSRENHRCEIVAARRGRLATDHEETSRVAAQVLDPAFNDFETIGICGDLTSNRGELAILRGELRGLRRTRGLDQLDVGQASSQPLSALG